MGKVPSPRVTNLVQSLVHVVLATICLVLFGIIGWLTWQLWILPAFDVAYDDVQPLVIPPNADADQLQRQAVTQAWRQVGRRWLASWGVQGVAATPADRVVALTFDDGPYPMYTPLLLDALKQAQVPATFFVIGRNAMAYPELIRRITADGHELGNHSFSHPNLSTLSPEAIRSELDRTRSVLEGILGWAPALVRPPGGRLNDDAISVMRRDGYTLALWNDNSGDFWEYHPDRLVDRITREPLTNPLILMHSGRMPTIRALPRIVDAYRSQGCRFVTLTDYAKAMGVTVPPLRKEKQEGNTDHR